MSLPRMTKSCVVLIGGAAAALASSLTFALNAGVAATIKPTIVTVTAGKPSEFRFALSTASVPTGTVTFRLTDKGALPHDFKLCVSPKGGLANTCTGTVTKLISPGASTTLTYTFKAGGTYEYLCTLPGHAASGMKGDLKVT